MNSNHSTLPKIPSIPELSIKKAVGLLFSFARTANSGLGQYMKQVAQLAREIGEILQLDATQLDHIEMAGLIHDIGLISLPGEFLKKDVNSLTQKQLQLYGQHPVIASVALESVESLTPVGDIILFHHEYMNGKGFPNGLSGYQIPLGSRIILVASDYCRIIATWPRNMRRLVVHARRQLGMEEWKRFTFSDDPEKIIEASAEKILLKNSDKKYDDEVVNALIRVIHKKNNIDPTSLVGIDDLKSGMVMMDDLHLKGGRLLITKGTRLTGTSIQTLQGLESRGIIPHELCVAIPGKAKQKHSIPDTKHQTPDTRRKAPDAKHKTPES